MFEHFLDGARRRAHAESRRACNREIKFGVCFEHALRLGADLFATGHYARVGRDRGRPSFCAARTRQGPELLPAHRCRPRCSARTLFPIGDLHEDARCARIARERALPVHDKRDSTGICFIGERPFAEFLCGLPACAAGTDRDRSRASRSAPIAASCTTRSASGRASSSAA